MKVWFTLFTSWKYKGEGIEIIQQKTKRKEMKDVDEREEGEEGIILQGGSRFENTSNFSLFFLEFLTF